MKLPRYPQRIIPVVPIVVVDPIPMLEDKALGKDFRYADWKARDLAKKGLSAPV